MSTFDTLFRPLPQVNRRGALCGQTMGLVAVTAGLFAPGAYVGAQL